MPAVSVPARLLKQARHSALGPLLRQTLLEEIARDRDENMQAC